MSVGGLEPATNGLKGHCSTIELHAPMRTKFYHADAVKSTGRSYRIILFMVEIGKNCNEDCHIKPMDYSRITGYKFAGLDRGFYV